MAKKRNIREYRQVKDSVYRPPVTHIHQTFTEKFGNKLYAVLFHYNHHRKHWFCFPSDGKREYFNGATYLVGKGDTPEEAFHELQTILKKQ